MRTPPLLADFSHARACKPFCENSLTLPKCAPKHHYPLVAFVTPPGFLAECFFHRYAPFLKCKINHAPDSYHCTEQERGKFEYSVVCFLRKT